VSCRVIAPAICALVLALSFTSSFAGVAFDISQVSYEIDSRLDEGLTSLQVSETVSFVTGEKSYSELYFYIYQNSHPSFFSLDSVSANGQPATYSTPDTANKDLVKISPADTIPSNSQVRVKLDFSLRFGGDLDEYQAACWAGDFFCAECYPKLAEFDYEGAVFPDTTTPISLGKVNDISTCGTGSYLEETYLRMADYRLTMTFPADFRLIASGECRDTLDNSDGTRTYIYDARKSPGILWIATANRELLAKQFDGLKVCSYYPPGHRSEADKTIQDVKSVIDYYSDRLGPFPRDQLKVYLMNMPSFLGGASGDDILLLPAGGGIWDRISSPKTVLPHEVAHQWWGNAVSCGTGPEGWFAEALACYSAELFCSDHKENWPDPGPLGDLNERLALWLYIAAAREDLDRSLRGAGWG
jgi:hypothetical protein